MVRPTGKFRRADMARHTGTLACRRMQRRTGRNGKILLTIAVVGTTGAMATMGTYAAFTDSANVSHSIQSGTIDIELGATGAATNRLNVNATGIVPGDT